MSGADIWATNDGIYLGLGLKEVEAQRDKSILEAPWEVDQKSLYCYPSKAQRKRYPGDRHLLTIGPNGSGKTRRLLMTNLLRLTDWSMVVVDIKGELAAATAAYRAKQKDHRVVVIDPFGVMKQSYPRLVEKYPFLESNGYNPVSALDPESQEFPDNATALAEALITVQGTEPHWSQSAQDLVAALIMATRIQKRETGSLLDVRKTLGLSEKEFCERIDDAIIAGEDAKAYEIAIKAERFAKLTSDNKELNSILSTALTQTRWLDSRPMKIDLSVGSFDFATLKKEPTTVYLILPPRYLVTHATWLRVLITSALMPLLRSTKDSKVPVLFMLDEFAQLGHMAAIENNMALMRGYGVKIWTIFQDLAQAQALYKNRWESFIGNAGPVQSFAPQDMTTREYLSKLSGQRFYWVKTGGTTTSASSGSQPHISKGSSENEQNMTGPVFWPQGLGTMDTGQTVIFLRGRPVRAYVPDPEDDDDMLGYRTQLEIARAEAEGRV